MPSLRRKGEAKRRAVLTFYIRKADSQSFLRLALVFVELFLTWFLILFLPLVRVRVWELQMDTTHEQSSYPRFIPLTAKKEEIYPRNWERRNTDQNKGQSIGTWCSATAILVGRASAMLQSCPSVEAAGTLLRHRCHVDLFYFTHHVGSFTLTHDKATRELLCKDCFLAAETSLSVPLSCWPQHALTVLSCLQYKLDLAKKKEKNN